jgi:hypothetical protein
MLKMKIAYYKPPYTILYMELLLVSLIKSPAVVSLTNFLCTVGPAGQNFPTLANFFNRSQEHPNRSKETCTKKNSATDE